MALGRVNNDFKLIRRQNYPLGVWGFMAEGQVLDTLVNPLVGVDFVLVVGGLRDYYVVSVRESAVVHVARHV